MSDLFTFILRHLFLILLYVFLLYILLQMFQFLKHQEAPGVNRSNRPGHTEPAARSSFPFPEARLVSLDKNYHQTPKMYPVGEFLNVGRAPDNNVVIADSKVSRYHARIYNKDGQYWVEDLNSKNGVFLNGKQIRGPVVLVDGDKLMVGHAAFVFVRWGHEVEQNDTYRKSSQY